MELPLQNEVKPTTAWHPPMLPSLAAKPAVAEQTPPWLGPVANPQNSSLLGNPGWMGSLSGLFGHMTDGPGFGLTGPQGVAPKVPPTVAAYGSGLDAQLDASIAANRATRKTLDTQKAEKSADADTTQGTLDDSRHQLLDSLKERSGVFDHDIAAINAQLGDKIPKNPTPEQAKLLAERAKLQASKDKYAPQQTALQRWDDRNSINDINTQLQDPALDAKTRTELLAKKKTLATGLLSTTHLYQQFDERWGSSVYGKDKSYTSMTEAGCGPTSLAMLLDFHDQEDPEGLHAQGKKDPITPRMVADYATNHGRVKGNGTDGDKMMADLHGSMPNVTGNKLDDRAAAAESLHNGIPVMFLGHNIVGQTGNVIPNKDPKAAKEYEKSKAYKGHFMVLNGVNDDDTNFSVLDGGRNKSRNMQSITSRQLNGHGDGYWNVK